MTDFNPKLYTEKFRNHLLEEKYGSRFVLWLNNKYLITAGIKAGDEWTPEIWGLANVLGEAYLEGAKIYDRG